MSVTVNQVANGMAGVGTNENNVLVFKINSNITGDFSADDRITITNSGTTFQNVTNATYLSALNDGSTSDFQIREIVFDSGSEFTVMSLEAQSTTTAVAVTGPPTDGPISGLTFAAYSAGGGGSTGKMTVSSNGKITVNGSSKITIK